MSSVQGMVAEFHEAFGLPNRTARLSGPTVLPTKEQGLRWALLMEEAQEWSDAIRDNDIVEIADALADMVYVIYGAALYYGIDLDAVIEEVHRSNMTKLDEDGKPIYREDGKVVKGPNFEEPDIEKVLGLKEYLGV